MALSWTIKEIWLDSLDICISLLDWRNQPNKASCLFKTNEKLNGCPVVAWHDRASLISGLLGVISHSSCACQILSTDLILHSPWHKIRNLNQITCHPVRQEGHSGSAPWCSHSWNLGCRTSSKVFIRGKPHQSFFWFFYPLCSDFPQGLLSFFLLWNRWKWPVIHSYTLQGAVVGLRLEGRGMEGLWCTDSCCFSLSQAWIMNDFWLWSWDVESLQAKGRKLQWLSLLQLTV